MLQLVFPKLGLVIIRHGPQCLRLQVVKAPKGSAKNCHFVSICPIIWKRTQILNYLSGKNPQDQSLILFSSLFQCKSIKLISPDYTINLHSLAKELRGGAKRAASTLVTCRIMKQIWSKFFSVTAKKKFPSLFSHAKGGCDVLFHFSNHPIKLDLQVDARFQFSNVMFLWNLL